MASVTAVIPAQAYTLTTDFNLEEGEEQFEESCSQATCAPCCFLGHILFFYSIGNDPLLAGQGMVLLFMTPQPRSRYSSA